MPDEKVIFQLGNSFIVFYDKSFSSRIHFLKFFVLYTFLIKYSFSTMWFTENCFNKDFSRCTLNKNTCCLINLAIAE